MSQSESLRDRCKAFLNKLRQDAILRQGSPVDDLVEFVVSEQGRAADPRLEKSLPVCLYFATDADRDEFIQVFKAAKPGMVTKEVL